MKLRNHATPKSRIEMLPLIDIVFLLLVVFIYSMLSMSVHHGLPVKLPSSSTAAIDKQLVLSVTLKKDGTIYVNETPATYATFVDQLKAQASSEGEPGVLLFADRDLPYQNIYHALDMIRTCGIDRISLQAVME